MVVWTIDSNVDEKENRLPLMLEPMVCDKDEAIAHVKFFIELRGKYYSVNSALAQCDSEPAVPLQLSCV